MWYIIQISEEQEFRACRQLRQAFWPALIQDCFVPTVDRIYKRDGVYQAVRRLLFPGYVFISTDRAAELAQLLRQMPAFHQLLGDGREWLSLAQEEAAWLNALLDDSHNIAVSQGSVAGGKLTIVTGPLKGYERQVKKIDRHKRLALVEVHLGGRDVRVPVSLEVVSKT